MIILICTVMTGIFLTLPIQGLELKGFSYYKNRPDPNRRLVLYFQQIEKVNIPHGLDCRINKNNNSQ